MPINVVGGTSAKTPNTVDTSSIVQQPYLRGHYMKRKFGEDIDMKNQLMFKDKQLFPPKKPLQKPMLKRNIRIQVYHKTLVMLTSLKNFLILLGL